MKTSSWLLSVLMTGAMAVSALAFVPPTDDQIGGVLADHSQLNALLVDANPEQIASVVGRALNDINSATLSAASKSQTAALLYTRALLLSGEKAPQMVAGLAGQIDAKLLPVIAASTAIAMGSSEGPVFTALVDAAGAGAAGAITAAAADPSTVMDADSIALVQQLVIELRGVAAPVIPPPSTAPMNLVPPIVPQNTTAPTPPAPPVADTYQNQ